MHVCKKIYFKISLNYIAIRRNMNYQCIVFMHLKPIIIYLQLLQAANLTYKWHFIDSVLEVCNISGISIYHYIKFCDMISRCVFEISITRITENMPILLLKNISKTLKMIDFTLINHSHWHI